ncbi:hypothetical protein GWI33_000005 [Rhynchophorus ferrugineus]|uniref:Uncharacterized protein n=1 Tax=Rhynchophorus ferrugineus TaxID=354439 RepID=A0A834MNR5_RHYFE|nr:hypothetical protein GWI33_000005 [Rhynchophorus ferrugineus]
MSAHPSLVDTTGRRPNSHADAENLITNHNLGAPRRPLTLMTEIAPAIQQLFQLLPFKFGGISFGLPSLIFERVWAVTI